MFADGLEDPIQRQGALPLVSVVRVIASARAIQAEESRKAIRSQFTLQHVESVPLELLVGQLVDDDHSPCCLLQDTGFRAGIRGARMPRGACFDQTVAGGQQHVCTRRLGGSQVEGVEQTVTSGNGVLGGWVASKAAQAAGVESPPQVIEIAGRLMLAAAF